MRYIFKKVLDERIKQIREILKSGDIYEAFLKLLDLSHMDEGLREYTFNIANSFDIDFYKIGVLDFESDNPKGEIVVQTTEGHWSIAKASDIENILARIEEDYMISQMV